MCPVYRFGVLLIGLVAGPLVAAERPNLLIITVDDMSCDSIGAFGCKLAGTTPTIDRLAGQGMKFTKAHVVVSNCFPSRNVMWSGKYPHATGVEGFYEVRDAKHPHLADLMKGAGYTTGIYHKVSHSTPYSPYPAWDVDLTTGPARERRDVKAKQSYRAATAQGIAAAKSAGKPFCLVMNVADPHKPFYAEGGRGETVPDANVPSLVYTPEQVPVPGFLFDDPVVRKELAHYYSSVRRADDCVAEILAALDEADAGDHTIIVFLSDHGMPLPFAKTQVYHHSTHTPLTMIVPGMTKPGATNATHMVSTVDLLPTLLELTGVANPGGMDGRSFVPLLKGQPREGHDFVIKEYNENAGGSRDPMRAIQTADSLYIFNPWSNGERAMATATLGTSTYRRMKQLAAADPALAARLELFIHRVPEEFYDVKADPDCLVNLIDSPAHRAKVDALRAKLATWMETTGDGMLPVFQQRDDAVAREAYVAAQEAEADARRAAEPKRGNRAGGRRARAGQAAPDAAATVDE